MLSQTDEKKINPEKDAIQASPGPFMAIIIEFTYENWSVSDSWREKACQAHWESIKTQHNHDVWPVAQ
jgi:hypothetical protein